jgi:hypothetical protein
MGLSRTCAWRAIKRVSLTFTDTFCLLDELMTWPRNIGVLQTTVAEVVTVEAHQRKDNVSFRSWHRILSPSSPCIFHHAIRVVPGVSQTTASSLATLLTNPYRSIVGAGLGGTLAEPVKNYPGFFQTNGVFARFPYLLPNLVCAAIVVFGLVVGFLFLEETHEDKKEQKDRGIEIGQWLVQLMTWRREKEPYFKAGYLEETLTLIAEEEKLDFDSAVTSPLLPPSTCATCESQEEDKKSSQRAKIPLRQAFTRQVSLIIVSYGILAL